MTKARDLASGGFGLVLVKPSSVVNGTDNGKGTVSFSGASSVSLNGVFSATYTNYKMLLYIDPSAIADIFWRGRTNGSDNSNSTYYGQRLGADSTTIGGTKYSLQSSARLLATSTIALNAGAVDIFTPFISEQTLVRTVSVSSNNDIIIEDYATMFDNTTSFDGITFFPGSGTITGQVSIYGYNN